MVMYGPHALEVGVLGSASQDKENPMEHHNHTCAAAEG